MYRLLLLIFACNFWAQGSYMQMKLKSVGWLLLSCWELNEKTDATLYAKYLSNRWEMVFKKQV